MARINVEDSLYKDIRFIQLVLRLGSIETALGAMVRAWSLAQEWYLNEETDRLIPVNDWKRQLIKQEIIDVGLAEVREKGIYVIGAKEQFAWLLQRQEAGKKGGRPSKSGTLPDETDRLPTESGSNPLTLSLSPSLSQDLINSVVEKDSKEAASENCDLDFGDGEPEDEEVKSSSPPPKTNVNFQVLEEFADDSTLADVLQTVSNDVQKRWIQRYELSWLKKILLDAIQYYLEKENAVNTAQITGWGFKLGRWLSREKKPHLLEYKKNLGQELEELEAQISRSEGASHGN